MNTLCNVSHLEKRPFFISFCIGHGVWQCEHTFFQQIPKKMAVVPPSRKGTAKLNELLDIERSVQERWEKDGIFEEDAPEPGSQKK